RGIGLHEMFDSIVDAYLPNVRWESPPEFEARAAALLPGLLLARIDGKSPAEYLGESQRDAVRAAARSLIVSPRASLRETREFFQAAMQARKAFPE
ncbi:MAG: hypothetical protein ABI885_07670, partial [Gammaproteobacteria bacterium]